MDANTIERMIAVTFKNRNVYLTTSGPKKDRKDLIQRKRDFCKEKIQELRALRSVA